MHVMKNEHIVAVMLDSNGLSGTNMYEYIAIYICNMHTAGRSRASLATGVTEEQGAGVARISSTKYLFYHLENEPITSFYTMGKRIGQPGSINQQIKFIDFN